MVFGISKSKKLDNILDLFDKEQLITDLYLVSRPHMRLYSPQNAYKMVQEIGSAKLRDLVATSNDVITTQSDSNSEGKASSNISSNDQNQNNIGKTLDFLVKDAQNGFMPQEN